MNLPSKIGNFRMWNEGDGPAPYVFSDMPAGSRCAWTCVWNTRAGLVLPNAWGAIDRMTPEEVKAELEDIATWSHWSKADLAQQAQLLLTRMNRPELAAERVSFLTEARSRYPEYVCVYCPPDEVANNILRKGWEMAH